MTRLRIGLAAALLGAPACLPKDLCDPGFNEDHGACYPLTSIDGGVLDASLSADAGSDAGAGSGGSDPSATHGKVCSSQADCGGIAPSCGYPQLPYCTSNNCMSGTPCPNNWKCFDIRAIYQIPGVDSVCLKP